MPIQYTGCRNLTTDFETAQRMLMPDSRRPQNGTAEGEVDSGGTRTRTTELVPVTRGTRPGTTEGEVDSDGTRTRTREGVTVAGGTRNRTAEPVIFARGTRNLPPEGENLSFGTLYPPTEGVVSPSGERFRLPNKAHSASIYLRESQRARGPISRAEEPATTSAGLQRRSEGVPAWPG